MAMKPLATNGRQLNYTHTKKNGKATRRGCKRSKKTKRILQQLLLLTAVINPF
jgi:hypothetical protein